MAPVVFPKCVILFIDTEFHLSFYHWVQKVLLQLFIVTFSLAADMELLK